MTIRKKLAALLIAAAMVLGVSVTASAGSHSMSVTGYGTLYGDLSTTQVTTRVSYNNDNAYLQDTIRRYNAAGDTIGVLISTSPRGSVYWSGSVGGSYDTVTWRCTHAVEGGTQYRGASFHTYAYR